MMPQEPDMPDRRSIRLKDYDYSENGAYFVTICTKAKEPYFDRYPELKKIVESEWDRIPEKFPVVFLDSFVVMSNHIHGIIFIDKEHKNVGAGLEPALPRATSRVAPTLGTIVGTFKSLSLRRWAKYLEGNHSKLVDTIWQRNYYEHIIRDENELNLVREYIVFNPFKWSFDMDNPDHIYDEEYTKRWKWLES